MNAFVMSLVMLAACANETNPFLATAPQADAVPREIVDACDLAKIRCSRCHTPDRIIHSNVTEPAEWKRYVRRMRLMPGSAIRSDEEPRLVRCFVFRTSGNAGLARLSGDRP